MKAVICAIAKFEYDYIKEWVEYHLNLGFDKIVIYDNNDLDGEQYDDLLSEFIKKGKVELRDVRGKRAMQRIVYNEFYHEGKFDWVAIIDIDEFICLNKEKYKNIKEFIKKKSNADAIYLYWQTYGDSGKTFPIRTNDEKEISILDQYCVPAPEDSLIDNALKTQNSWGKSIIKNGLPIKYLHEHFVTDPNTLNYVDCFGNKTVPYLFYPDRDYVKSTYTECYIKHIYTKSLYEYIDCKVRRPAANAMGEMHFPSKYFKINEINEEKRKYLESIGYKMEFVFKPDVYLIIEVKNLNEYYRLKPYILNIVNLCSCRFNLCVTEDETAVDKIAEDIGNRFNECAIYYYKKDNVLSEFCSIYSNDRKTIVEHTQFVVHLNIPYNVDINKYIKDFIDPLFNQNNIQHNFNRMFSFEKGIYVSCNSIEKIDINSDNFIKFKNELNKAGVECNMENAAFTGNFIIKTSDCLQCKEVYEQIKDELENPEILVYFISSMIYSFLYTK